MSDIYYDNEDSPKVKALFGEIQEVLYGKMLAIIRPIPTRFLQMKAVCDRLVSVYDGVILYYTAFLDKKDFE